MATQITTDEELAVLLGTLGDTADAIAANLRAQDIKGFRSITNQCPVARWLWREVDGCTDVDVDDSVNIYTTVNGPHLRSLECDFSNAVRGFIENFDERRYPDLIDAADR
jgi:hypothetical protein